MRFYFTSILTCISSNLYLSSIMTRNMNANHGLLALILSQLMWRLSSNRETWGLRRGFSPIGDGIKLFKIYNRFRFVYQNYNYKHRFVRFGPIALYYINWSHEIDIPSEPSEGTTFFTIPFRLCGALTKPMRTSTELQSIARKLKLLYC